jgi:hypothetical protein
VSRRRLLLVALVVLGGLGAGCADDVAPAASIGDRTITTRQLLDEVAEWAESPTLAEQLGISAVHGAGPGSYDMTFVDFLLTNRISFEVHNAQFEALDLVLTDEDQEQVRAGLFPDPAASAAVFEELSPAYGDELVADVARQFAVSEAMGAEYDAWRLEALSGGEIEINPKYGSWDPVAGQMVPPEGPRAAPSGDSFVEL